tara:strand:+ start:2503 stop:2796 length:294 start_codon:yes stop_codon:yes gene_type:complete
LVAIQLRPETGREAAIAKWQKCQDNQADHTQTQQDHIEIERHGQRVFAGTAVARDYRRERIEESCCQRQKNFDPERRAGRVQGENNASQRHRNTARP